MHCSTTISSFPIMCVQTYRKTRNTMKGDSIKEFTSNSRPCHSPSPAVGMKFRTTPRHASSQRGSRLTVQRARFRDCLPVRGNGLVAFCVLTDLLFRPFQIPSFQLTPLSPALQAPPERFAVRSASPITRPECRHAPLLCAACGSRPTPVRSHGHSAPGVREICSC